MTIAVDLGRKATKEKINKKLNTFLVLFSNKMVGIHKILVRIANREDPDQSSDSNLRCLSRPLAGN